MNLIADGAVPTLEAALRYSWQRHEVILNNLANVSTPGFKAQDLPMERFQAALSRATGASSSPMVLGGNPVGGRRTTALSLEALSPIQTPDSPGPDGNSVVAEIEAAKLAKNAAQFTAVAQLLTRQFDLIEKAIRERV